MWQNIKYYVLAYAIMVAGALLSSAFQMLGEQFPAGHPAGTIAANLSGVTIGGMIMVIGFLRDSRVEAAEARVAEAEARADLERERAAAAEARAERERERSDRMLERYEAATNAIIKRLDELNGAGNAPPAGKDPG